MGHSLLLSHTGGKSESYNRLTIRLNEIREDLCNIQVQNVPCICFLWMHHPRNLWLQCLKSCGFYGRESYVRGNSWEILSRISSRSGTKWRKLMLRIAMDKLASKHPRNSVMWCPALSQDEQCLAALQVYEW